MATSWYRKLAATLAIACLSLPSAALACTGIMLRNADGSVVHGRTVEFGVEIDASLAVVPRGIAFTGTTPQGTGMRYSAKYAVVGVFAYTTVAIADGLNEKGLAAGAFYFPGFARYAELTAANTDKAVSPIEFTNWLLTQFATVTEARAAIERGDVVVAPTAIDGWGTAPPPLHYVVYDRTGASIVVEPIDGRLDVSDNPIGVITNSPDFGWHMTNLRNYLALQPENATPLTIEGVQLSPLGQGTGLLGLPGDFTPPARFVRAVAFTMAATKSPDSWAGVRQVFHILNNFDIPVGAIRETRAGQTAYDFTQMTVVRDPQTLRYYWTTYDDQSIKVIDLSTPGLTEGKMVRILSVGGDQNVRNLTQNLSRP
jgi:choloylglycine hydrolase